jgi:large subunit ribosomal protein L7/L12
MADTAKLQGILDQIKELTLLEAADLVKMMEETFGVSAAAAAVAAAPAGGAAPAAAEPEKEDFDVILSGFDAAKKIGIIKVVREIAGLGLAEAKAFVEGAPKPVKEAVDKPTAEKLKKQIEDAGGKVTIK